MNLDAFIEALVIWNYAVFGKIKAALGALVFFTILVLIAVWGHRTAFQIGQYPLLATDQDPTPPFEKLLTYLP